MAARHTPGPWIQHGLVVHDTHEHPESQHPQRSMCIATVNPWKGNEAVALADAALIAAAPDLLAACEAAYHALRSYQYGNSAPEPAKEVADRLEVALSEARGLDHQE